MKIIMPILIITLVLSVLLLVGFSALNQSQAKCYTQAGAATVVASSGCYYVFQSGSNFSVEAGATVSIPGSVLGASGVQRATTPVLCAKGQTTVTDTVTLTSTVTAITTPNWASCNLNAVSADANVCSSAVGTPGSVVVLVKNSLQTPAANAAGALVNWEVCGVQ